MKMKSFAFVVFCFSHFEILGCRSTLAGNVQRLAEVAELELQLFGLPSVDV